MTRSKNPLTLEYKMKGEILTTVKSSKYLGVLITNDLSWEPHINQVINDSNKILGFLRRNFSRCDSRIKATTYQSLVRPKLEYAATVWDPHQSQLINKLEMVQRRAARFATSDYRRTSSVTSMLHTLHWPTLQQRRKKKRLMLLKRAINEEIAIDIPSYVKKPSRQQRNTNLHKYTPIFCRTQCYKYSFLPRTLNDWNSLPTETALSQKAAFEQALDKFIKSL
ncbi:uncharacterized protein [Antedon mediterranea]|uniref:uncharacterized protein n=1 Tax=Antedon mediterranea TaxID=105859 RepID=UPI003AF9A6B4